MGLTNPGAETAAKLMGEPISQMIVFYSPPIFASSVEEFVEVAKIMAPVSNGIELNLSCPHASGYGMAMGQDPELVKQLRCS